MSRLLALRHAATDWNEAGLLQGRIDRPLSPKGRAEAAAWRLPAEMRAWSAACSPLVRAGETARLMGLEPEVVPALIEMSWGDWEGRSRAALRRDGLLTDEEEAKGLDLRAPGGESPRQVAERLRPWLAALGRRGEDSVAIVHKGVLRALLHLATDWDFLGRPPVKLRDGIALLFDVAEDGALELLDRAVPLLAAEAAG